MKYLITLIVIISTFITGCSNQMGIKEQNIIVEKRIVEANHYEDFKVVKNSEKVKKVRKILDKADWENAKVDMARIADYRFIFQFKNPDTEAKAVLYELWISPNKDKVELVIDAQSKYVQLDKKSSSELFKILTSRKL
ncbi:hypothetical protein GCM10007380_37250 [Gottfriedia solisilvae]|uniref:YhfM-like domain-containing protein n=1 Tax=Gottfriedia solisilvae TaxID=1516104 RepID=A0A8J3F1T8_9BACI|nr:hypothetical protein GCM10007380_37250 [Gottfriedia solisilvae]